MMASCQVGHGRSHLKVFELLMLPNQRLELTALRDGKQKCQPPLFTQTAEFRVAVHSTLMLHVVLKKRLIGI